MMFVSGGTTCLTLLVWRYLEVQISPALGPFFQTELLKTGRNMYYDEWKGTSLRYSEKPWMVSFCAFARLKRQLSMTWCIIYIYIYTYECIQPSSVAWDFPDKTLKSLTPKSVKRIQRRRAPKLRNSMLRNVAQTLSLLKTNIWKSAQNT